MKKPLIGITLDCEDQPTYSEYPWYALRKNYISSVVKHGGIPILLPHEVQMVSYYSNMLDGLLMTGGDFDVDPSVYGEQKVSDAIIQKDSRTDFEMAICKECFDKQIPILGICAGEQIMNVIFGGTLHQHIPDSVENCLEHEQKTPKHLTSHSVKLNKESKLYEICGKDEFMVNSTHHQAVKKVADGFIVNATAPDGVIEGIETKNHKFCIGVEWHPEYLTTEEDNAILQSFIAACREK